MIYDFIPINLNKTKNSALVDLFLRNRLSPKSSTLKTTNISSQMLRIRDLVAAKLSASSSTSLVRLQPELQSFEDLTGAGISASKMEQSHSCW